jgi:hypothetical protein
MRIVCTTYVGHTTNNRKMIQSAETYARAGIEAFRQFDTTSEFNSATYIGVTLLALSLAKYCPKDSMIAKEAPQMIRCIWEQICEIVKSC